MTCGHVSSRQATLHFACGPRVHIYILRTGIPKEGARGGYIRHAARAVTSLSVGTRLSGGRHSGVRKVLTSGTGGRFRGFKVLIWMSMVFLWLNVGDALSLAPVQCMLTRRPFCNCHDLSVFTTQVLPHTCVMHRQT